MVRNGDAHLKNFAVLYASPEDKVSLSPVYDVVITTAYIKHDVPALSLAGSKKWWPRKALEQFASAYLSMPKGEIDETIARLAEVVMETRLLIPGYIADHPEFRDVGGRMMSIWADGVQDCSSG